MRIPGKHFSGARGFLEVGTDKAAPVNPYWHGASVQSLRPPGGATPATPGATYISSACVEQFLIAFRQMFIS
jgi:hypothetical protein